MDSFGHLSVEAIRASVHANHANHANQNASRPASSRTIIKNYPYTPSIASSASSSSSSVFSSTDAQSSQSSAPSSVKSATANWEPENSGVEHGLANHDPLSFNTNQDPVINSAQTSQPTVTITTRQLPLLQGENTAPQESQVHPRRTQPLADSQDGKPSARPPPALVRQCDRKDNFVESLVDTTTQMIEVIWPLSVITPNKDTSLGGRNLIGLRTFIQEVLKRSKTSYSTLQVALYYLVLIKPCIPKVDFTQVQPEDSHASRAMQCGRRMFLAALILASKYLQDRNYSARAWSKISGLKVSEINEIEMAFVTAVDWKLHIPEPRFQRWTDVVLKFSPPPSPTSRVCVDSSSCWRSIIPRLTPELDEGELSAFSKMSLETQAEKLPPSMPSMSPPRSTTRGAQGLGATHQTAFNHDPLPTHFNNSFAKLEALEPRPSVAKENFRFPPISPKITQLPTPQLTPRTNTFHTPAVSMSGFYASKPAMCSVQQNIQGVAMAKCTMEPWPSSNAGPDAPYKRLLTPSRRSSLAQSVSSVISSPESMISDVSSQSSRSSRSSPVCSTASSAGAPAQPIRLAVQATRRCATMQMSGLRKQESVAVYSMSPSEEMWTSSPSAIGATHCHYNQDPEATAALALGELASAKPCPTLPMPRKQTTHRKRERPLSIAESSALQDEARALLQPSLDVRAGSHRAPADEDTVAEDPTVADSFLLRKGGDAIRLRDGEIPRTHARSMSGSRDGGARKRMCCKDESWTGCESGRGATSLRVGPSNLLTHVS